MLLKDSSGGDAPADAAEKLRRAIEEAGRAALKYHPGASRADDGEPPRGEGARRAARVDLWAVRAAPRGVAPTRGLGRAVASPHRYLGEASMDARYARRVALDQLPTAARCLVP